ncbi:MAG: GGDEF domain-containing protein [Anaerolineales bacterium]
MQKIHEVFEARSPLFWTITSTTLVGVTGIVDYLTGNEISLSLFYLIPISLSAWYANQNLGLSISILSAITWFSAEFAASGHYAHPVMYFWNTLIRFGFFIILTYLVSELHKTQKSVRALAQTDYMTGAINSRYFHELLGFELNRAQRYKRPFTVVYLDLDNFKQVNDKFGHYEGDQFLRLLMDGLKRQLRNTDIVSRLGGDEFAILFPETRQQEAEVIMAKIHSHFTEQFRQKYPFVTFSAGAVTYTAAPNSIAETIKIADDLMYTVKNSTKNGTRHILYMG